MACEHHNTTHRCTQVYCWRHHVIIILISSRSPSHLLLQRQIGVKHHTQDARLINPFYRSTGRTGGRTRGRASGKRARGQEGSQADGAEFNYSRLISVGALSLRRVGCYEKLLHFPRRLHQRFHCNINIVMSSCIKYHRKSLLLRARLTRQSCIKLLSWPPLYRPVSG